MEPSISLIGKYFLMSSIMFDYWTQSKSIERLSSITERSISSYISKPKSSYGFVLAM